MKEESIYFFSEGCDFVLSDEDKIRSWINELIVAEGFLVGQVNYIFCTDEYLLKINKEYLMHDFYTDIITFDFTEEEIISGDIFISIERADENANKFAKDIDNEINRLISHGVLHLIGYKDNNTELKTIMTSKEDYYLSLLA